MRTKKTRRHVYFQTPYSLADLKKIDASVDDYFTQAVLDDFAEKYRRHSGFSPRQIGCIGIALNRLKAISEAPVPPDTPKPVVEPVIAISVESVTLAVEKPMTKKAILLNTDLITGSDLKAIKNILREKFRYTPKATISGIVEKDSQGVWRESCLRYGQGAKKSEICRKQEYTLHYKGNIYRIPLPVLAYFLQNDWESFSEGELLPLEKIREKLDNGHEMKPYNKLVTRKTIIGKVIEL